MKIPMKKILLLGCLAALFTLPVQAADEETLQLARDVLKAVRSDAMVDRMWWQFEKKFDEFAAQLPTEERAAFDKLRKEGLMEMMMEEIKAMKEDMAVLYTAVYTAQELKAIKVFFESPEGSAFLEKQPRVSNGTEPLIRKFQQRLAARMQEKWPDIYNFLSKPQP